MTVKIHGKNSDNEVVIEMFKEEFSFIQAKVFPTWKNTMLKVCTNNYFHTFDSDLFFNDDKLIELQNALRAYDFDKDKSNSINKKSSDYNYDDDDD